MSEPASPKKYTLPERLANAAAWLRIEDQRAALEELRAMTPDARRAVAASAETQRSRLLWLRSNAEGIDAPSDLYINGQLVKPAVR